VVNFGSRSYIGHGEIQEMKKELEREQDRNVRLFETLPDFGTGEFLNSDTHII
jgi:hypothetical protein